MEPAAYHGGQEVLFLKPHHEPVATSIFLDNGSGFLFYETIIIALNREVNGPPDVQDGLESPETGVIEHGSQFADCRLCTFT
ncbi:MAG: hypothetical protein LBB48_02275 [Treponema sp.]|nr:hypothetical protein [Treponema sp.]